ncbi:hypothetical protein SAMN05216226_1031, partial [Halovenus aranensis]
ETVLGALADDQRLAETIDIVREAT